MPRKTAKKKPMSKVAAKLPPALRAMDNQIFKAVNLDVRVKELKGMLDAAGFNADIGSTVYAGRAASGTGEVQVNIGSSGFASTWPEWAYGVAEGALHFNKRVLVIYNDQPFGFNLLKVFCMNTPV
jgi:hypothetical protein